VGCRKPAISLKRCIGPRFLSVTRGYCVNTTQATIMRSSLEDSLMTLFMVVNFTTKFRKEHRARLLMRTNADDDDDDADDAENDDDDAITKILQGNVTHM